MRRTALCATFALLSSCGFFRELESIEGSETATSQLDADERASNATGTTDGACQVLDNHCENQDVANWCNADTGDFEKHDCVAECSAGGLENMACVRAAPGNVGCWCSSPSKQKVLSCGELEACFVDCQAKGEAFGVCGTTCFTQTSRGTGRMFGALVACAQATCSQLCIDNPANCDACAAQARQGYYSDCENERAVCDLDQNDDLIWP